MQAWCNTCDREISQSHELQDHVPEKSIGNHFNDCDFCNETFPDFKCLLQHKTKDHGHGSSDQFHICIEDQLETMSEPTDIAYVCSKCGSAFDFPRELEQHINMHGNQD
jgi:uncharacterized C2H2 Zn-finger protein